MCVLQKERFLKTGWEHADALDMMTVYSMLPQDDVARYGLSPTSYANISWWHRFLQVDML